MGQVTTSTRFGGRATYTTDGLRMAIAGHSGVVLILDAASGMIEHRLPGPVGSAYYSVFSHDGNRIATGGLSDAVNIWDLKTGDIQTTMPGMEKFVVSLAFSPDDKRLITATNDDRIRLWDTATGREIMQVDYLDGQNILVGVDFTPDGRSAIAADSFGRIFIYDTFPHSMNEYPGTAEDPPQLRVEWLKRRERIGPDISREDVARSLKTGRAGSN
jgi:WD40 repeat protein